MPKHAAATSGAAIAHLPEDREEAAELEAPLGQTRADRLVPLPENVLSLSVVRRSWNGANLDVISAHCQGRVAHHLCYESHTRLAALLEEVGSPCEPRLREHEPCAMPYVPRHLYFVPAGMAVWGYSADMRFVQDAVLTFDLETVGERLEQTLACDLGATPRLRFADERLWTLVKLLADVVDDRDPSTQLYGDGLTAAIVARLMSRPQPSARAVTGLAPWQLRRVVEYLEAHISQRVELATLATLVGLSQSHFSHAFRVSTGVAPYRWQLDARIRRAQRLLLEKEQPLEIMGEAVRQLSDATKQRRSNIPWKRIAGTRDRLIHNYFGVDLGLVWNVTEREIPALKSVVGVLLLKSSGDDEP